MTLKFIAIAAFIVISLCVLCIFACRQVYRRGCLSCAYRRIGELRRNPRYRPDIFAGSQKASDILHDFLRSYLKVPDSQLGYDSASHLTDHDLSRMVTLWEALGDQATLCYGMVREVKDKPFDPEPALAPTIWIEFSHLDGMWVYRYGRDSTLVEPRSAFYRRGSTVIHSVTFAEVGPFLFRDGFPASVGLR